MSEKLGLTYSPDKVEYLFVGEAEGEQGSTPWYKMDFEANKPIPVYEDAIRGFIYNLVVTRKEFKGKTNYKLNIYIQGDHRYQIRAGVGTTFSRGFLLALQSLIHTAGKQVLSTPLTVTVKQGDEGTKAVFSGLFDEDGHKIVPKWDGECQLTPVIQEIQGVMGQVVQTKEMMDDPELYYQAVQEKREADAKQ